MFKGFSKWLRGPNAEDVTLEVIGLVKGTECLTRGEGNVLAADEIGRVAKRAQRVLREEGNVLNADVRKLLTMAVEQFKPLSEQPSAKDSGKIAAVGPYAMPIYEPLPAWNRGFETARHKLDSQATKVFSHQFAIGLRAEIKDMDAAALAAKQKSAPKAMALLDGHLRKVPAPPAA